MTVDVTPTELLAGFGVLLGLFILWRGSVRRARAAADAARAGMRVVSLAGRVLVTAGVIVGAQWLVIRHPLNTTVLRVVLALGSHWPLVSLCPSQSGRKHLKGCRPPASYSRPSQAKSARRYESRQGGSVPKCFAIMPISTPKEVRERYGADGDHFVHVAEHIFKPATEQAGYDFAHPPLQART